MSKLKFDLNDVVKQLLSGATIGSLLPFDIKIDDLEEFKIEGVFELIRSTKMPMLRIVDCDLRNNIYQDLPGNIFNSYSQEMCYDRSDFDRYVSETRLIDPARATALVNESTMVELSLTSLAQYGDQDPCWRNFHENCTSGDNRNNGLRALVKYLTMLYTNERNVEILKDLNNENVEKDGNVFLTYVTSQLRKCNNSLPVFIQEDTGPSLVNLTDISIEQTFFGPVWKLCYHQYAIKDDDWIRISRHDRKQVHTFFTTSDTSRLPCTLATPEQVVAATHAAANYISFMRDSKIASYTGVQIKDFGVWGKQKTQADGRIMIDLAAMRTMEPNYPGYPWDQSYDTDAVAEDESFFPFVVRRVFGFSFRTKSWGEFCYDGIHDVKFRDDAFDLMVMDEDVKLHVRDLISSDMPENVDIIDGKGGGLIFLSSGEPGTGKTLLAETVAEVLHRPLYDVGIDELGTSPHEVEENLKNILAIAARWNAVLLINEADVYVEERSANNIERNAIVSVFLRLTEYYPGVLFMTTNRGANLDPAIKSRVTMHLNMAKMSPSKLAQVWINQLGPVENVDVNALVQYSIDNDVVTNGRAIKNTINQARRISSARKVDLNTKLIIDTISASTRTLQ